jgi:trigger factor
MKDKILEEDLLYIANAGGDYEKLYGKSILITGATGLVGSQIVKALLKMNEVKNADITIYAFVRNAEKADKIYDEFAKDVSEFDTLDELKADIKKQMNERKAEEAKNDFENQLIEQVIDNMECEVPQCMFDKRVDEMVQDYAYRLQMQGIDLDTYLKYLGQDKDAFKDTFKDGAQKQVKASIALEAIVEAEKLEATEEEIDAEIAKLAEQYQMEADQIKNAIPTDQLASDVKTKKAIDLIVDSAVKE